MNDRQKRINLIKTSLCSFYFRKSVVVGKSNLCTNFIVNNYAADAKAPRRRRRALATSAPTALYVAIAHSSKSSICYTPLIQADQLVCSSKRLPKLSKLVPLLTLAGTNFCSGAA